MRKKLSCIILSLIMLICACTFVSCKKEEYGETDITPPKPLAPPITWLYFDCIEDITSLIEKIINNSDVLSELLLFLQSGE